MSNMDSQKNDYIQEILSIVDKYKEHFSTQDYVDVANKLGKIYKMEVNNNSNINIWSSIRLLVSFLAFLTYILLQNLIYIYLISKHIYSPPLKYIYSSISQISFMYIVFYYTIPYSLIIFILFKFKLYFIFKIYTIPSMDLLYVISSFNMIVLGFYIVNIYVPPNNWYNIYE